MASSPLLFFTALVLAPPAALSAPSACNCSAAPTVVVVTLAAVLPERNLRYLGAWPRVRPALSLALEALEPDLRHAGLCVCTAFASSEENGTCSLELAHLNAAKLKVSENPDVLLGMGCDGAVSRMSHWASVWGLPLLEAGDYGPAEDTETAVYAGPAPANPRDFLSLLHQRFNWTSRFVVAFSHEAQGFRQYFGYTFSFRVQLAGSRSSIARRGLDDQPDEALQFIRAHGRVVYIYGSPETIQQTMRLAQAQHMTNGDYIFIYLDILGESLEAEGHREAAKPWQSKEGQDAGGLREAFQTVLVITSHKPQTPEYQQFQSQLILRAQSDFGVALNGSLHKNLVAGCFHDALLLYIRALNETLREGGTKRDTSRILEKMRGLKIQGVTGTVSTNRFNEREMDFDLWAMADAESGEYQVVGHYVGSEERIKWLGSILWKKGGPPLDNPPCVFNMNDPSCGEAQSTGHRPPSFKPHVSLIHPPAQNGGTRFPKTPSISIVTEPCLHHSLQGQCCMAVMLYSASSLGILENESVGGDWTSRDSPTAGVVKDGQCHHGHPEPCSSELSTPIWRPV